MSRPRIDLPAVLADPHGTLKQIRAAGPIAEGDDGVLGVFRYDVVRELLNDGRLRESFEDFLHSLGITSGVFHDWMAGSPLNHDGPEHQRWRGLMSRTFTPRSVERLRPFLREAAHELIDGFAAAGACEFMAAFADVYPSLGLCELIGVPAEDRERFCGWANTVGLGFNLMEIVPRIGEIDEALTQLIAYAGELAALRAREPRDDLVSRIARAAEEDGWAAYEVRNTIAGLVFAGHETTKNQLGWMVAALAERPEVWEQVAGGELAAAEVVEEVMRFRSAVTSVGRAVAAPVECAGERLEPGTRVFLSLWSANRDERVFPRPDEFAPAANAVTPHVSFGHGPHHCLGAALARAELQEALTALTARITCPVLADGAAWRPPLGITGPERLPIVFREKR